MELAIDESPTGVAFAVRVTPRAGRTTIRGVRSGALLVRIAAPPVDGAANDALIAFLAKLFDRPKRDVTIVSGGASRDKRVAVSGVSRERAAAVVSDILRS
jgi:uncharacterized protein (TIGR00251 family)